MFFHGSYETTASVLVDVLDVDMDVEVSVLDVDMDGGTETDGCVTVELVVADSVTVELAVDALWYVRV